MRSRTKIFSALIAFLLSVHSIGQTTTVTQDVMFSSGQQNMWGPSFGAVTMDDEISLFHVPWNVGFNTGNGGIVTVAGMSFGAAVSGSFSGQIGSKIRIEGFTSGTVEVDYPIDVDITMPTDLTYDQGDFVSVNTSYTVDTTEDWQMETLYPSAGEFFWDIYFQMAAQASATLCAFGCTTFPIVPAFNTGLVTINLLTISTNGASTGGETGIWMLGPADPLGADGPGIGGWPYSKPLADIPLGDLGLDWIPWQVYTPLFPLELPDTPFGLSGEVTIPYVETDPYVAGENFYACGDSAYFNLNLEIFKLLGFVLSYAPPPANAVGEVLSNLSGEEEFLGLVTVNWNLFSASFDAEIFNNQCFSFDPSIYGSFQFPLPVTYNITDTSGTTGPNQVGSIINCQIGETFSYQYPCNFEELAFVPTYSIVGMFTNHTYDSIAFEFQMSAFAFGISIPAITVIPGFTIPSVCFPVPYPCPSWSCPWCWCTTTFCTPVIVVPPIGFPGLTVATTGNLSSPILIAFSPPNASNWPPAPFWEYEIPLGAIEYDWFNETWALPGFVPVVGDPIIMRANPLGISNVLANVTCNGLSNGSINITTTAITDATPFSYTWTNGATTEDLSGLPAGSYQVSVIDSNGCQMFTGGVISEPLALSLSTVKLDKSCNGIPNDGSIDLEVSGGTPGYTYAWSTGGGSGLTPGVQDQTGLSTGTYSVTVTDLNSCTASASITIDQPPLLGQSGAVTHVDCFGATTGSVDVSTFGGTMPYTFTWLSGQTTEDISNLPAGTYTLTVQDNKGCQSIQSYIVNQPAAALALSSTAVDVACHGQATGSINLTTTGGTAGYTYSWSDGSGVILPFQTEDLSNLAASTYTVLVQDSKGCTASHSQSIAQPTAPLSSTPSVTAINCFGVATGAINPGIAGGTAPYTYAWSNGATTPTLSNVVAGTYVLTVTDGQLCTDTYSYTVNQPASAVSVSLSGTDIKCFGDATGAIVSNATGGSPGYTYVWNTGATTANLSSIIAGNYSITVTDSKGCTANASITLNQPLAPLAASNTHTDVNCFGQSTGAIDVTVNGGTTPYSYIWTNGSSFILSTTTQDLSNLAADYYAVTVTDANGCLASTNTTITQPVAPLALTGTVNDVNCFGISDGAVDITVTGGTVPYTYVWSNGASSQDITNVPAGVYTVAITDGLGCTINGQFTVLQPNAALTVSTTTEPVTCFGFSDGAVNSFVSGGTQPYTYAWSNSATTSSISLVPTGIYTLTVTDAQGCTAFTGATVSQPTNALNVTISVTDPTCYGYSDGEIALTVTGGTQPYYFNWGNQNEILLNNPSETLMNVPASSYLFRVRDDNNCIFEQIVTVNQPTPLVVTAQAFDALCYGANTGSVDLTVSGSTPPYTYQWSDGQTTEDATALVSGAYEYTVTDFQGCEVKGVSIVGQPDELKIDYTITEVSCVDQFDGAISTVVYGGTAPYTYVWSTGATTTGISELAPGTYMLTVSDDNLCESTFDFVIDMSTIGCIDIPNTITPNGDNYNDTWIIENIELYPNVQVKIFNKWGNLLYSQQGTYTPWDGTVNGEPLPSEVYYYIITLGNPENDQFTGTITIVR